MFERIPSNRKKSKLVCGVGVNDADYLTQRLIDGVQVKCKIYVLWKEMIARCYSEYRLKRRPTYRGCSVCDDWLVFSKFSLWMSSQDWQGKQLDKDIKVKGNKVYSPDTCLFVSSAINNLFLDCKSRRGAYPLGVSFDKNGGRFKANVNICGKDKSLGYYDSPGDAGKMYIVAKNNEIMRQANLPENQSIKEYLIKHLLVNL